MHNSSPITWQKATTPPHFEAGKQLFEQYIQSLDFVLDFQDVERELQHIAIEYNAPTGALLLGWAGNKAVACAGVRAIDTDTAELKRMFVDPAYRGLQLGKTVLHLALQEAQALGYRSIRLDTVPDMHAAIKLYRAAGFYDIAPYRFNPIPGAIFMECKLG